MQQHVLYMPGEVPIKIMVDVLDSDNKQDNLLKTHKPGDVNTEQLISQFQP